MNKYLERIYNGVIKENPTFILILGMCPTLAVTTSVSNAFGMGVSTMIVLVMSNLIISLMRKMIPDRVRIPAPERDSRCRGYRSWWREVRRY